MTEIIRVVRTDFDSMENHSPRSEKTIATFLPEGPITAYGKAAIWFRSQPPVALYTGYDLQVYPQFKLIMEIAN
jgi:hypothetical protein